MAGPPRSICIMRIATRVTFCILFCVPLLISTAAAQSVTGEWSSTVNGVQGRLSLAEDKPVNGTRMLAVYLELKNVSDVGNPIEIYYDPTRSLKCDLVNAETKPVVQAALPADILTPSPYWLSLPFDSVLRFRVSVYGYSIPRDGGRMIQMSCGAWLLKEIDGQMHKLEVTLVAVAPEIGTGRRAWTGQLRMIRVVD